MLLSKDTKRHETPGSEKLNLANQVCQIGEKRPLYKIVGFMRKWALICAKKGINFVPVWPVVSPSQLLDLLEDLAHWTLLPWTTTCPNTEEHLKSDIQQAA